jgi:hypothetical protein
MCYVKKSLLVASKNTKVSYMCLGETNIKPLFEFQWQWAPYKNVFGKYWVWFPKRTTFGQWAYLTKEYQNTL